MGLAFTSHLGLTANTPSTSFHNINFLASKILATAAAVWSLPPRLSNAKFPSIPSPNHPVIIGIPLNAEWSSFCIDFSISTWDAVSTPSKQIPTSSEPTALASKPCFLN